MNVSKKIKLIIGFLLLILVFLIAFSGMNMASASGLDIIPTSYPTPHKTQMIYEYGTTNNDKNIYNGYWEGNYWIAGVPSYETLMLRMPIVAGGSAVVYDRGLMEATARQGGYDISKYVGSVAVPFWSEVGHEVWIYNPEFGWDGPFLIVDISRQIDVYRQIVYQNQVVELDFETGKRWGMWKTVRGEDILIDGRLDGILVSKVNPELADSYPAIQLSDFFLENVKYTTHYESPPVYRPPKLTGFSLPIWKIGDYWVIFPGIE